MKIPTVEPSCPTLRSLKHDDIIKCLLESVQEVLYHRQGDSNFGNWDQKKWLRDVTNDGLDEYGEIDENPAIKWDNPQSVSFAILHLAAAGRTLNVKKWEDEGIDDFIGTYFPKFKENPSYRVYPTDYVKQPMLNQVLNIPQSNADFLCQYWRPEHCDSNNWNPPSTYGVEGVWIVNQDGDILDEGDKSGMHMKKFGTPWDNPTRYGGTALERVNHYYKVIIDEAMGIKCLDPIYYDIDDNSSVNGNGREGGGKKAGLTGWQYQPMRFVNKEAKLRFAMESQPKKQLGIFGEELSKEDVYTGIKVIYEEIGEYNLDKVYADVEHYGARLVTGDKQWVKVKLKKEFEKNGNLECTEQFQEFDTDTYESFLNKMPDDEWVKDIFNNEDERVQFINANKFNHYYSNIMNSGLDAKSDDDAPLNFLVTFPIPSGKSAKSLQSLRDEFFSKHIAKLENTMLRLNETNVKDRNRLMYPWNNPECKHMALAQDRKNENNYVVIPLRNRNFN